MTYPPHAGCSRNTRHRSTSISASRTSRRSSPPFRAITQRPDGCLLLADDATSTIGCVALRALVRDGARPIGEVKRLYVCREGRGRGVGRALAEAVIARARALDYCELKLDTLANMVEARALYAALGFRECAPYYANPLPGVAYMALALH